MKRNIGKILFLKKKNSWAGIEGIPLNWWNIHVFKVIGAKLGGLLEIDKETTAFSVLNFAKIRAKGFTYGFLPSVLELPRGSDTIMLGVFPLDEILSPPSAIALGPAFRRGLQVRNSFEPLNSLTQDVAKSSELLKEKGLFTDVHTGEKKEYPGR